MFEDSEQSLIDQESKAILNEILERVLKDLKIHEKNLINKIETDEEIDENHDLEKDSFEFDTECHSCNSRESPFWRRVARNKIVCNKCFFNKTYLITINNENKNSNSQFISEKKTRSNNKTQQSTSSKRILTAQLSSSSNSSTTEQTE